MRLIQIYQSLTLIGCDSNQKATAASWFRGFGEGDGFESNKFTFTQFLFLNIRRSQSKLWPPVQALQTLFLSINQCALCQWKYNNRYSALLHTEISILVVTGQLLLEGLITGPYVLNAPSSLHNSRNSAHIPK